MISAETLRDIHRRMRQAITEAGGEITDIFHCPHRPDEGCDCRKPKPGMILKAAQDYDIDPSTAWMIGDSAKDIECGLKAGCKGTILVKTGNERKAMAVLGKKGLRPNHFAQNLLYAVEHIISQKSNDGRTTCNVIQNKTTRTLQRL